MIVQQIMMNFMMMTMDTQTSRAKRLVKMLERLIKKDYLYDDSQIKTMKAELRLIKEELAARKAENSKGFGS